MKTTHWIRLFAAVLAGACLIAAPRAEASSTNINDNADEFALYCTWDPDFDCAPGSFSFTASATCHGKTPDPTKDVHISAAYTVPGGAADVVTTSGVNQVTLRLSGVGPGPVVVTFSGVQEYFRATVYALKVDIVQTNEHFCIHAGKQTLDLTADSYLGPDENSADWYWADTPGDGSGDSYSFTPSKINPCSVTVRADAQVLPACNDSCKVNIVKVHLDIEDGTDAPGGFICVTNGPGQTVTRKQITINKCEPASWDGHVTLDWAADNVKVYSGSTGGDEVTSGTTFANAALPKDLWVEGTAPSAAVGNVVFRLNPVEAACPNAVTG